MSNTNHELYLPASDSELLYCAKMLDKIAGNFAIDDGWHIGISLDRQVTLDDSSVRAVKFEVSVEDDADVFEVIMSERLPINAFWNSSVAANLLGEDYMGLNVSDHIEELRDEWGVGEEGFTEGYLERERTLKLIMSKLSISGMVVFNMNVMDDCFGYIDTEVGYAPGVYDNEQASDKELERLIKFGELLLDISAVEKKQSQVTRADLIVTLNTLKGAGIAPKSMRAYKDAPLKLNGADFFSIHGRD